MVFSLYFTPTAEKELARLDTKSLKRMKERLGRASATPQLFVKRLKGIELFSLRVGDYRAILRIDWSRNSIIVVRIGHRHNVYDKL